MNPYMAIPEYAYQQHDERFLPLLAVGALSGGFGFGRPGWGYGGYGFGYGRPGWGYGRPGWGYGRPGWGYGFGRPGFWY